MVMRHQEPSKNHPIWKDGGPPDLIPRTSPYRSSSNANFLMHQRDEVPKYLQDREKVKVYKRNSVIATDTATEYL